MASSMSYPFQCCLAILLHPFFGVWFVAETLENFYVMPPVCSDLVVLKKLLFMQSRCRLAAMSSI